MTPKHVPAKPPPLPPRKIPQDLVTNPNDVDSKVQPGGRVVNAQKSREQELSEKEKAKKSYEEKYNLMVSGKITEEEFYNPDLLSRRNIDALLPGDTKSVPNSGLSDEELKQLLQAGVISQEDLVNNEVLQGRKDPLKSSSEQKLVSGRESGLTEEKVRQLLQNGVLLEEDLYNNDFLHTNLHLPKPGEPQVVPRKESSLSTEERMRLFQEGIIPIEDLYDNVRHVRNAREYGVAEVERDPAPKVFAQADIQAMFDEFHMLELNFGTNAGEGSGLNLENSSNYPDFGSEKPAFRDVQNFHVMRDNTAAQNIYDQVPLKKIYDSPAFAQNSLSSFLVSSVDFCSHS